VGGCAVGLARSKIQLRVTCVGSPSPASVSERHSERAAHGARAGQRARPSERHTVQHWRHGVSAYTTVAFPYRISYYEPLKQSNYIPPPPVVDF